MTTSDYLKVQADLLIVHMRIEQLARRRGGASVLERFLAMASQASAAGTAVVDAAGFAVATDAERMARIARTVLRFWQSAAEQPQRKTMGAAESASGVPVAKIEGAI